MSRWKVTYRGKDGSPVEDSLEAESRAALFSEITKRGIRATRVEECPRGRCGAACNARYRGRPFLRHAVIVGVVGILCAFICLFRDDSGRADSAKDAERLGIADEAPSIAPNHHHAPSQAASFRECEDGDARRAETNGFSRAKLAKWRFRHRQPAAWTNDSSKVEPPEYATFDFQSEKEIICLLTVEPGDMLLGDGDYGPGFERDFLKSLTRPIIVSKDDTLERTEWKRMMIEAKRDLKARMDAGESISEIMSATRREFQRMADMKGFLADELRSLRNKEGVTVQEVNTCIEAANLVLEAKGVSRLKISPLLRKALMRKCVDYRPDGLERN